MRDFNKILLTGGTGFLGYNLYQVLRRTDPNLDLWVYSRRTGGDVIDYAMTERAIEGKDLVINLAAQTSVDYSIEGTPEEKRHFIDTNTIGTLNVLMAARKHNVKVIHMSTSEIYGTNQNPGQPMTENHPILAQAGVYAVSKAAADLLCRMAFMTEGQDVVVARVFNMYGPHQSIEKLIPKFINQALNGSPLSIYGSGEQRRDYVWACDAAEALWKLRLVAPGEIVNIGTEKSYTVNELAEAIISVCGASTMKVHTLQSEARPAEVAELNGSNQKLYALTGYKPATLIGDGIHKCRDWYSSNGLIMPPRILNYG